ncbi:MAG: hypothetical protein ABFS35_03810 [Bacteroidota bacterium]
MKKFLPFLMVALIFSACTKDESKLVRPDFDGKVVKTSLKTITELPEFCNDDLIFNLLGETSINHGTISVNNDEDNLYVTFNIDEGWTLYLSGVYAGALADVPVDAGGEIDPFQFEVVDHGFNGPSVYTYAFPLIDLDECFIISAVAKILPTGATNTDTYDIVWTKDHLFVGYPNTWGGGYAEYCEQDCEPPACYGEETAWSFGTTFESLTGTTRWGWYSVYTVGEDNDYIIYAGQTNDIGTLYVSDDGVNLTVRYETEGDNLLGLAHLYVGNVIELEEHEDEYMNNKGTPVPGHFPYTDFNDPYDNSFEFVIPLENINSYVEEGIEKIIVAAHAEAYLPVECEE